MATCDRSAPSTFTVKELTTNCLFELSEILSSNWMPRSVPSSDVYAYTG